MMMGGPRGTLYSGGSRALSGRSREEVKGQAGLSTGIQAHAVKGLEIQGQRAITVKWLFM